MLPHDRIIVYFSPHCIAAQTSAIGTKVTNHRDFLGEVTEALAKHDESEDLDPGSHIIALPPSKIQKCLSGGSGLATKNPQDYVVRYNEGEMRAFLKRELAVPSELCTVCVYSRDRYLQQLQPNANALDALGAATHVIVEVLSFSKLLTTKKGQLNYLWCVAD